MDIDSMDDTERIRSLSRILGLKPKPSAHLTDLELQEVEHELHVRLPPSYRTFLSIFGATVPRGLGLLGLPRGRLAGDLVLRNYLDRTARPPGFVKFLEDDSAPPYYLATPLVDVDTEECPVVLLGLPQGGWLAAHSFLDFLERFGTKCLRRRLAGYAGRSKELS